MSAEKYLFRVENLKYSTIFLQSWSIPTINKKYWYVWHLMLHVHAATTRYLCSETNLILARYYHWAMGIENHALFFHFYTISLRVFLWKIEFFLLRMTECRIWMLQVCLSESKMRYLSFSAQSTWTMDGLLKTIFTIDQTTAVLIATLCVVMLIYILFEKGNIRYQLPAGPVKWPFMGNIPQIMLAGSMPRFCQKYSKI